MSTIDTFEHKGLKVEIWADEYYVDDLNDPRSWDNVSTMICFHRVYVLGDEQISPDIDVINEFLNDEINVEGVISLPLYLMDHSGISMNTGGYKAFDPEGWDWGFVGVIYMTQDDIAQNCLSDKTNDELNQILIDEVSIYSSYLEGDIVGYTIYDESDEILDSCGGFVGSYDYCVEEAKETANYYREDINNEKALVSYWNSRDIVTV